MLLLLNNIGYVNSYSHTIIVYWLYAYMHYRLNECNRQYLFNINIDIVLSEILILA
jgi:hypothetical protein